VELDTELRDMKYLFVSTNAVKKYGISREALLGKYARRDIGMKP
jgi:hypothetical protein